MPKLYTKTGDTGKTSLYDGSRQSKSHIIFDVLGNLDELSSQIGLLCAYIGSETNSETKSPLRKIQVKLLDIGSNIAVIDPNKKKRVPKIIEDDVKELEKWIDICENRNKKLTVFLLPGVNMSDSQCHICRSTSRRVERSMWKLDSAVPIDPSIFKYVNRLSDFFFAFSRNLSNGEDVKVGDYRK